MNTIAEKIKKVYVHPYHRLAKKYDTSINYIRKIATADRVPIRGKGLLIKKELEKIVTKNQ